MNVLTDALPTCFEIDGREYDIDTDFRAALRVIMAYEDNDLTGQEKQAVLLGNLYSDEIPPDINAAFDLAYRYLNGGEEADKDAAPGPRIYSFSKDAALIYAAFQQTHGIDLQKADLHWWQFLALFMDLGADTVFCSLTGLRKRLKTGKATKEERELAREMGEAIELPEIDDRTLDEREREAEFMRLIGK